MLCSAVKCGLCCPLCGREILSVELQENIGCECLRAGAWGYLGLRRGE
jgi:hypothetical protein